MFKNAFCALSPLKKFAVILLTAAFMSISAAAMAPAWMYSAAAVLMILLSAYLVLANPEIFIAGTLSLWTLKGFFEASPGFALSPSLSFNMGGFLNFLLVYAGAVYLTGKGRPDFSHKPVYAYGLFLLICGLSLFYSEDFGEGVKFLVRIACPFSFYCIIIGEIKDLKKSRMLLRAFLFSSIVPFGAGAYQLFSGTGFKDPVGIIRIQSVFEHPISYAFYMALLLVVLLAYSFSAGSARLRGVFFAGSLAAAVLLISTCCRSAWVAAAAAFIWLCFRYAARWRTAVLFLVMAGLMLPLIPGAGVRASSMGAAARNVILRDVTEHQPGHQDSLRWRYEVWTALLREVPDAPLTGRGTGSSYAFVEGLMGKRNHAHSNYVLILYENGVPGLIVFIAFLYLLAVRGVEVSRHYAAEPGKRLSSVFMASFILFSITMAADNIFEQTISSLYYWTFFAVGEVMWREYHAGKR